MRNILDFQFKLTTENLLHFAIISKAKVLHLFYILTVQNVLHSTVLRPMTWDGAAAHAVDARLSISGPTSST